MDVVERFAAGRPGVFVDHLAILDPCDRRRDARRRHPFGYPEAPLPQPMIGADLATQSPGGDHGHPAGPVEIARVHRTDRLLGQTVRDLPGLEPPLAGQPGSVDLTLDPSHGVPCGLTMADQPDDSLLACSGHGAIVDHEPEKKLRAQEAAAWRQRRRHRGHRLVIAGGVLLLPPGPGCSELKRSGANLSRIRAVSARSIGSPDVSMPRMLRATVNAL